ncbi:dTMP kinase [Paenibacillus sp. 1182]|uniref:dTMP kinase n=1 Tax=Paenibacillus sp. 1182 TaxID=2806565 RepID=UPI001AE71A89|nr:dTMP kinase [Paenibacillus sp. 1182]
MKRGVFVTLEGGEGAGKSLVIQAIKDHFAESGKPFLITREPGGIEIAEKIRTIILEPSHTSMDGRTEALLYAAARRQHLVEKVFPALNQGITVICDRFMDSSLVYQGYARGLGFETILELNQFAIEGCMPDVTIWLDVDPKVGLERISRNNEREVNRLDLESVRFHEKVHMGYQILHAMYPERIHKIDANQTPEDVVKDVIKVILNKTTNMDQRGA